MQIASIPPLVGALVFGVIGLIVIANRPWTPASIGYAVFALTTVWWQGCWALLLNTSDPAWAFLMVRIGYSGIIFLPITFYHFSMEFVEPGKHLRAIRGHYAIGFGFLALLWATPFFLSGCRQFSWGYYPKPGVLYPGFLTYLVYLTGSGIRLLYHHLHAGIERSLRTKQIKFVLVANVIYIFASVDFVVKYGANFYPFGVIFCLISSGIIAFAVLRYQLMDMASEFRNGIIFFLIAVVVGVPLSLLVFRLSNPYAKAAVGLMGPVLGAVLLGSLKGPLAKMVDRLPLFRERYERLKTLEKQKNLISKENSEKGWSLALGRAITEVLGPCEVSVLVYDKNVWEFKDPSGGKREEGVCLKGESEFLKVLSKNTILIGELLETMVSVEDVEVARGGMEELGAEVSIPIRGANGGMVAVVSVGEKKGGGALADFDITMLWGLARVGEEALRALMAREELVMKERLAAIGEMASVVSHEVKTPLAVIQNSAHFLKSRLGDGGDEKVVKHLGIIGVQAEALDRIVKGILDYARAKELSPKAGKVNEMVREVVETLPRAEGVEIELKLMKDLPDLVFDDGEMRQALTNVLNNAMEALPQGGKVEVATGVEEEGGVYLRVRDNGVGIAREHLTRIFEPFFTTRGGGTGLGLAVVKKVLERHGGEVGVESEVGKGTAVTLTLPVNGGRI